MNAAPAELGRLVHDVIRLGSTRFVDVASLASSLEQLLSFLASPEGFTETNIRAASVRLAEEHWADDLPDALLDLLLAMSGPMRDSLTHQERARELSSTPEHLLVQIRKLVRS